MSAREIIGGEPTTVQFPGQRIELLDKPYVIVPEEDPAVVLRVLAHAIDQRDPSRTAPVGIVSTKPGRSTILGEFSGKPTGEYLPCNAVKGFAGEGVVYNKNVSTDTPLSGLRTAIAQRRAARTVRRHLK